MIKLKEDLLKAQAAAKDRNDKQRAERAARYAANNMRNQ